MKPPSGFFIAPKRRKIKKNLEKEGIEELVGEPGTFQHGFSTVPRGH
jgi:hypothetical protein